VCYLAWALARAYKPVGLITTALLPAVPIVYMPQTIKQSPVGEAALLTGALKGVLDTSSTFGSTAVLDLTLVDPIFHEYAMAFATRYLATSSEKKVISLIRYTQ
jgi:hypothetical protein